MSSSIKLLLATSALFTLSNANAQGILDEVRLGVKLKKVEINKNESKTSKLTLLDQIKAGKNLRSIEDGDLPFMKKKEEKKQDEAISKLLNRRKDIECDDDEEDNDIDDFFGASYNPTPKSTSTSSSDTDSKSSPEATKTSGSISQPVKPNLSADFSVFDGLMNKAEKKQVKAVSAADFTQSLLSGRDTSFASISNDLDDDFFEVEVLQQNVSNSLIAELNQHKKDISNDVLKKIVETNLGDISEDITEEELGKKYKVIADKFFAELDSADVAKKMSDAEKRASEDSTVNKHNASAARKKMQSLFVPKLMLKPGEELPKAQEKPTNLTKPKINRKKISDAAFNRNAGLVDILKKRATENLATDSKTKNTAVDQFAESLKVGENGSVKKITVKPENLGKEVFEFFKNIELGDETTGDEFVALLDDQVNIALRNSYKNATGEEIRLNISNESYHGIIKSLTGEIKKSVEEIFKDKGFDLFGDFDDLGISNDDITKFHKETASRIADHIVEQDYLSKINKLQNRNDNTNKAKEEKAKFNGWSTNINKVHQEIGQLRSVIEATGDNTIMPKELLSHMESNNAKVAQQKIDAQYKSNLNKVLFHIPRKAELMEKRVVARLAAEKESERLAELAKAENERLNNVADMEARFSPEVQERIKLIKSAKTAIAIKKNEIANNGFTKRVEESVAKDKTKENMQAVLADIAPAAEKMQQQIVKNNEKQKANDNQSAETPAAAKKFRSEAELKADFKEVLSDIKSRGVFSDSEEAHIKASDNSPGYEDVAGIDKLFTEEGAADNSPGYDDVAGIDKLFTEEGAADNSPGYEDVAGIDKLFTEEGAADNSPGYEDVAGIDKLFTEEGAADNSPGYDDVAGIDELFTEEGAADNGPGYEDVAGIDKLFTEEEGTTSAIKVVTNDSAEQMPIKISDEAALVVSQAEVQKETAKVANFQSHIIDMQQFYQHAIQSRFILAAAAGDEERDIEKGVWISGSFGKLGTKGKTANDKKSNADIYAGTIGIDAELLENITFGLSYTNAVMTSKTKNIKESLKTNGHAVSLYSAANLGNFIFNSSLTVANNKAKITTKYGAGKMSNITGTIGTEFGYKYNVASNTTLIPTIGANYSIFKDGALNITGDGGYSHKQGAKNTDRLNVSAGMKVLHSVQFDNGLTIRPDLHAIFEKSVGDTKVETVSTIKYQDQETVTSRSFSSKQDLTYKGGLGLELEYGDIKVNGKFELGTAKNNFSQSGSLKLRIAL